MSDEMDRNLDREAISDQRGSGQAPDRLKSLAWIPISVLFGTIILMRAVNPPFAYNSPSLMLALNFFVSFMLSLLIIRIIVRPILLRGSPGLLLLGCGVLLWGAAGVIGNAVARGDANTSVTIHNTCVWLSAICHLSGVVFWSRLKQTFRGVGLLLGVGCAAVVVALISVVLMTRAGWLPTFFVQGQGGTMVRFFVLASAIAMFALTAGILWSANRPSQTAFSHWYSLALLLIAVGLLGVMIQPSVGSLVGWAGVTAQLLSSPYMLMAVFASRRESGAREIVLGEVINERRYRYGVAVAIVIAAAALRLAFLSSLGTRAIYSTFYPAVILAAMYGGLMPGLLAAGLSAFIADYFWMEPVGNLSISQPADLLADAIFLTSCAMICFISERMRRVQARAAIAEEQAKYTIERARAQETLRQTEERFRLALRNAPVSVAIQDRNFVYQWAYNQRTRRTDEIIGKTDADLFAPEDMPVILETKRNVLESGAQVHVQHWITSNGRRLFLDLNYEPIRNSAGEITGIGVAVVDLTAQKMAEEALRESEERLRFALETIHTGAWDLDLVGHSAFRSLEHDRIFGYTQLLPEWTYEMFLEHVLPEDRVTVDSKFQQAMKNQSDWNFQCRIRRMDGQVRWIWAAGRRTQDTTGAPRRMAGIVQDITDRKQAEEALREAHNELELRVQRRTAQLRESEKIALDQMREIETYYHTAPIGLCVLDTELRYLRINELLAGWNGFPASEHFGRTLREVLPWLADEAERVARQVIETGRPVTKMEITGETPDQPGIKRTWLADWYPMKDSTGTVVNLSVVVEEVTQQRQLEEQLRQSQKMEAIGTLAGGIAHDFNNMLAAILGFTEMALEDLPDRPDVERNLQNVSRAAMRARDLVKQILAFSRKTSHERSPLSLKPLIKETVQLLRASIPATIEIRFTATATSDMVLAAPIEIQQILMNLATNASLAMQEKGGTLEISLTDIDFKPDSPVFGEDISPGEYVHLVVKDTGTGMTPDVMKRVFEPFFTTREVGKGTGMGLAVVYGIVKDLQGTITVESEPGVGSTFSVLLPKVKTDTQAEAVQTVEVPGGKERILFVDDEEMLVEWGRATLERLGYKVTAMTDSREALKTFLIDPSLFDLVITDHAMPQMAGAQLANELLKIRRDIPIILCTGHSNNISPEGSREMGVKEFLTKPVSKQELAEAVRRVLDGKDWRVK
jgi:PAS domain S-box-containing protein